MLLLRPCSDHWKRFRIVIDDDDKGAKAMRGFLLVMQLVIEYTDEKDIYKLQDKIDGETDAGCMFCYIGEEKSDLLMERVAEALKLSPDEFKKRYLDLI